MRIVDMLSRLMGWLFGDRKSSPIAINEVNQAVIDDSPRVMRITLWAIFAFFICMFFWSALADIDEVARGEGRAIPLLVCKKFKTWRAGLSLRSTCAMAIL